MSLTIKCPECEKSLKVKEEAAGKKVRCPACATAFLAPGKKKSSPPEDDFLADLGQAAKSSRKRPAQDEDFEDEDEDELPVTKSRPRPPVKKKSGGSKSKGPNWLLIGGALCSGTGWIVPAGGRRWAGNENGRKPKGQLDHLPASNGIYPRGNARNTRLQRTTVRQRFTDLYAESSKLSDVNDLDCPPSRRLIKSDRCRSDV